VIDIEVREFKKHDLRGGIVIDGFPNIGLVGAIFSSYLVAAKGLDQIACLDSEKFPPVSMIFDGKPKFPARIYAGTDPKIAVFVAEFTPPPALDRPLATRMLKWAREQEASMIITSVTLPFLEEEEMKTDSPVLGVASTQRARDMLAKAGIKTFDIGMITGAPAVLLNEGRWNDFDVIALLVKAHPLVPDHRAAAKLIETMSRLIPNMKIDVGPLYEEATKIEDRLKSIRAQALRAEGGPTEDVYK